MRETTIRLHHDICRYVDSLFKEARDKNEDITAKDVYEIASAKFYRSPATIRDICNKPEEEQ